MDIMQRTMQEEKKLKGWRLAKAMAGELMGIQAPKKTTIVSMMDQYKINVRTARNLYRQARLARGGHKKRHAGKN
jgi:hypothetical protein